MLRSVFASALILASLGPAAARSTDVPTDLPPLAPMPDEGPALPNGTTVSQPLTECLPDPLLGPPIPIPQSAAFEPAPRWWSSGDALLLWAKPQGGTGARFALGWSAETQAGVEVSYLFAGTGAPHDRRGWPDAFPAWSSSRIQSWGATGLADLYTGEALRVSGLAGYRYFSLNERLRFERESVFPDIDARNRFHGGELGLRSEMARGSLSLRLETRVALGRTVEAVRVGGLSMTDGLSAQSHFAVLPEGGLKLGYRLGERARFSVGYTAIFLNDAVRLGDPIDRAADGNPLFGRSDYWVQGVTLGLDWRY